MTLQKMGWQLKTYRNKKLQSATIRIVDEHKKIAIIIRSMVTTNNKRRQPGNSTSDHWENGVRGGEKKAISQL